MKQDEDFWSADDFEDVVASTLIACFETNPKKNRGAPPSDRMTEQRIAVVRAQGPYLPSNSRLYHFDFESNTVIFDTVNDRLPDRGFHAYTPSTADLRGCPGMYFGGNFFRRVDSLGKGWHKQKPGTLYEMISIRAMSTGMDGERSFFTVSRNGEVSSCIWKGDSFRFAAPYGANCLASSDDEWMKINAGWASFAIQSESDRRFCWTITAQEKDARAHLGCMREEIKSLLYARSLPMSETGRKRPILHLVESHKRRIRNGTDIDVTAFLRGQQTVEFGGTVFHIKAPATLYPTVSTNSQKKFYGAHAGA